MDHDREREIIERVLAGDRQAYALLVDAYKGPVFNLACRMTGSYSDADDLTQETFIRAYQKLEQFNPEKKFFTWLYTISINLIRNHLKRKQQDIKHKKTGHFLKDPQPSENDRNEEGGLTEGNILLLETQLLRLSVESREAILLRDRKSVVLGNSVYMGGRRFI